MTGVAALLGQQPEVTEAELLSHVAVPVMTGLFISREHVKLTFSSRHHSTS